MAGQRGLLGAGDTTDFGRAQRNSISHKTKPPGDEPGGSLIDYSGSVLEKLDVGSLLAAAAPVVLDLE